MADTVGSLADKIAIMELKIYHMSRQVLRKDATEEHRQKSQNKVKTMTEQRDDLKAELSELIEGVLSGKKKMKIYRQFKMYNDPVYRTPAAK